MKYKFTAYAARWFDRANGNTYHSVRVVRHEDGATIVCPFQYGYGDCYRQTALESMNRNGWIPSDYSGPGELGRAALYDFERENGYPILWSVSDGLKRDCVANGKD